MSRFNQKGPKDEGPMTGRRMGRCTEFGARSVKRDVNNVENLPYDDLGNANGRGVGRGRGKVRGRGRCSGMGRGRQR